MGTESEKSAQLIPEGAIRLPDLTIGGKTPQELEEALISGGFGVSGETRGMLRRHDFTTLSDQQTLSLVRVKVSDLGLTDDPTTEQIYAKANALGLGLCPAEVGPYLRLAYKDKPLDEVLFVGMKPIIASDGHQGVFRLDLGGDGSWLRRNWAAPDNQWLPSDWIVFSLSK